MAPKNHRLSIFSQPLDRAALLAYFLGGIVPLIGLILVARRYAADALLQPGLASLVLSMALLSLASFFLLQKTTRQALRRAEQDNTRLAQLVESSRALAQPADPDEVLALAIEFATTLAEASAAFFVAGHPDDFDLTVRTAHGPDADVMFQHHRAQIRELAALALPENADDQDTVLVRGEIGDRPATAVGVGSRDTLEGSIVLVGDQRAQHDPARDGALTALAGFVTVALRNADLRGKQRNFFTHVTNLLVSALDSHLDYQTDHSRRVALLANRVGRAMKLDHQRLEALHFGALLHDIGMLRIDPESLDGTRMTIEEHPTIGYEMLKQIELWRDVAPLVRHHHERWDGNGYPDRLAGTQIPLECRIIAIAEAFDSMTSTHSYRVAVPEEEALERIRGAAGSQFDPTVVKIFLQLKDDGGLGIDPMETLA